VITDECWLDVLRGQYSVKTFDLIRLDRDGLLRVCVPPSCYDSQSPFEFLLSDHFRLRHSPNPSFDKRNITFWRFWWATGNGGQGMSGRQRCSKPEISIFLLCDC